MEVILKQDVKGTGKAGDTVKVSDGFARNRLIPQGLAVEATDANRKQIERSKAKAAEKFAQDKAEAEAFAKKLVKEAFEREEEEKKRAMTKTQEIELIR